MGNEFMGGMIVGAFAGVAAGLGVLVFALLRRQRECPECGEPIPTFRRPANRRQALWGGWTCPRCGCEIDRRGRKIEPE